MENNYTDNQIIEAIKKVRQTYILSQQVLGNKAGVSMHTVQNWEYGIYLPKKQHVKNMITSLNLKKQDYPELFAYAEITEEAAVPEAADNVPVSEETEEAVSEALSEENIAEISDEVIVAKKTEHSKAKPLVTIFKEQWLKIRKPFVIGVGVWIVLCVVVTIGFIAVKRSNEMILKNAAGQIKILIIEPTELALFAAILFVVTVGISVLIHFIIRKVRKK